MAKVRVLPDQVANQIAAGEVIERPASVVKELVENSIDAGATRIEVEFRNGGSSLMRIEDNGAGMSRDDALLALERHATSKIEKVKDLDGLTTMGFRGEALPSIASVSRFQLQTREADAESGTEVLINGGKLLHVRDCGMPPGTRMTVSKLFNTVPARRKFLKSVTTESAHIVHCVRLYALAHPEIGFTLLDDGRILFQSAAGASLKSRVAEIFGRQIASGLVEVDAKEQGMRMWGLIGKPSLSRSSRHEMLFFVNNRPVENKTLSYALVESYYGHIPKGRYPVAFLFLEIDPDRIDVNVHPAKREIRFREEAKARGFAVRTLLEALRSETASYRDLAASAPRRASSGEPRRPAPADDSKEAPAPGPAAPSRPRLVRRDEGREPAAEKRERRPAAERSVPEEPAPAEAAAPEVSPSAAPPAEPARPEAPVQGWEASPGKGPNSDDSRGRNWRYIGWAQGEFSVFDTGAGVVLLNARAAEQRVRYEQLLKDYANDSIRCQGLLLPQPLELDPVSAACLEDNLAFFERLGFEIAPFGRNFYRIAGVPTWMDESGAEVFVKETVGMLRQGSVSGEKQDAAVEMVAKRAVSRMRRTAGEPSAEEMERLVDELFRCEKPLTDPEGRPSLIEISQGEIDRRFQRRGGRRQDELF